MVEVASPSRRLSDVNDKVDFYQQAASIQRYLVVDQDRRRVVHYGGRAGGELEPRILRRGGISLAPPSVALDLAAVYADTAIARD